MFNWRALRPRPARWLKRCAGAVVGTFRQASIRSSRGEVPGVQAIRVPSLLVPPVPTVLPGNSMRYGRRAGSRPAPRAAAGHDIPGVTRNIATGAEAEVAPKREILAPQCSSRRRSATECMAVTRLGMGLRAERAIARSPLYHRWVSIQGANGERQSHRSTDLGCTNVAVVQSLWDPRPRSSAPRTRRSTLTQRRDYSLDLSSRARHRLKALSEMSAVTRNEHRQSSHDRTVPAVAGNKRTSDPLL